MQRRFALVTAVVAIFAARLAASNLTGEKSLPSSVYDAKTSYSGTVQWNDYDHTYAIYPGTIYYGRGGAHAYNHGWARFDIDGLPDDATVTGVELFLYQYGYWGEFGICIRAVLVQDVNASAAELYQYVGSGPAISDLFTPPSESCGWISLALYGLANAAVESCLTQGYIDVGIQRGACPINTYGGAYGYTAPTDLKAYLQINYNSPSVTELEEAPLNAPQFSIEPSVCHNARVRLRYALREVSELRVDVLDAVGRRRLTSKVSPARATGAVPLDVTDLPAGAYLVRVTSGAYARTLKLALNH
jgi:hypothetical protein